MPQARPPSNYDRAYAATRLEARSWSVSQLALMLNLMMSRPDQSETNWGAFDAIADLLGGIEPPK